MLLFFSPKLWNNFWIFRQFLLRLYPFVGGFEDIKNKISYPYVEKNFQFTTHGGPHMYTGLFLSTSPPPPVGEWGVRAASSGEKKLPLCPLVV